MSTTPPRVFAARLTGLPVFDPAGDPVGKVRDVVRVDGSYQDYPADAVVELRAVPGVADREGMMLVRHDGRLSVVLNDVVMNMDRKRDVLGFLFTTLLGSAPGPRVSRLSKLALVTDRGALRAELQRLAHEGAVDLVAIRHRRAAWPLRRRARLRPPPRRC